MSWRIPAWTYPALAASLAFAARVGAEWNDKLVQRPVDGDLIAAQSAGDDEGGAAAGGGSVYQRIRKGDGVREAEYGFVNFSRDKLRLSYRISEADFKRYNAAFGYFPEDIEALQKWRNDAVQASYKQAVARGQGQAAVDAAAAAVQKQYEQKLKDYLSSRGFRLEAGNAVRVDVPELVRRNKTQIKPIARIFEQIASQKGYRSMDIIGSVLSFAQTAIKYRQGDNVYKGKHTAGLLPPLTTVVLGWGDCDTKSGMVASVLANWSQMRMVGIFIPGRPVGHYLMGVLQIPDKGDMYIEYQGLQYVLLEPAGPGWFPPGRAADETVAQLNSDGYKIDPFF